ncbi:MAG: DUF7107 domain-containing protein, partial [Myxococcota bacterium]
MNKIWSVLPSLALLLFAGCGGRTLETGDGTAADTLEPNNPPASTCEDEGDCEGRALCVAGVCQAVADEGCTKKSECPADEVCLEGVCGPPAETCSSSEECLGALVCDGFSSSCVALNAPGCAADS